LITLDGQELQKIAGDCTVELPGADLERRFGPDWEVYKVRGKVFMLMTDMPGRPVVILKADPDDAAALREQYADITPGYHMNKRHWIRGRRGHHRREASEGARDRLLPSRGRRASQVRAARGSAHLRPPRLTFVMPISGEKL